MFLQTLLRLRIHCPRRYQRITSRESTLFLRQLAVLLTAGIPVMTCCEILEQTQNRPLMQNLVASIRRDLLSGRDLYYCLRRQQGVFDEMSCQLVKMGEYTGRLDLMLSRVADERERTAAVRKQIYQATLYPGVILLTALSVTLGMMLVVIPRFEELFTDSITNLPALTRWIFCLSRGVRHYGFVLFIPVLCFLLYLSLQPRLNPDRKAPRFSFMDMPLLSSVRNQILQARFARSLSLTLSAGLSLSEGIRLALYSSQHAAFARLLAELRGHIHSGLQLHQAMQASGGFPLLLIQMAKIGEESGTPEQMLSRAADLFEAEIHQRISRFCLLLEPLIMLVLGVLIGGLVIGMYLPIFKLGTTI